MNKTDRQILALQGAAKKKPKYIPGVKAKIAKIRSKVSWNKFLAQ